MMKAVHIRKVYYSDNNGILVSELVDDMVSIQASAITKLIYNMKTSKAFTWDSYFEELLKKLFPPQIKKINFENFIRHNLVNVLPEHIYTIETVNGFNIVSIFDSMKTKLVSSKLI